MIYLHHSGLQNKKFRGFCKKLGNLIKNAVSLLWVHLTIFLSRWEYALNVKKEAETVYIFLKTVYNSREMR